MLREVSGPLTTGETPELARISLVLATTYQLGGRHDGKLHARNHFSNLAHCKSQRRRGKGFRKSLQTRQHA